MLLLVFGVSVLLYIFDVPIIPSSTSPTSTVSIPTGTISLSPTSVTQTLSSSIDYRAKGRSESITVSVKLNGSIITELSSIHSMNDGKSRMYQQDFEAEIQPLVVGKDIRTLNLSRVAGASSTTNAFMQAIEGIKSRI